MGNLFLLLVDIKWLFGRWKFLRDYGLVFGGLIRFSFVVGRRWFWFVGFRKFGRS